MVFPALQSNEITANYYFFLKGQTNRGTCELKVIQKTLIDGSHSYHLISVK